MTKKNLWAALLASLVVAALFWGAWLKQQPKLFLLQVDNQSQSMVDQVRLFGTALQQDALLLNVDPGKLVVITANIKPEGTLKFEVTQKGNRIDTYIVEDTRILEIYQQRLVVHDNNSFILTDFNREVAN